MANATTKVAKTFISWLSQWKRSSATLGSATNFYPVAMLGITTTGYLAKFDDAASMIFAGLVRADSVVALPAGTAADGTIDLEYDRPEAFALAISSVAATDIGKTVYAVDDQTGTLDASTRTYANVVGKVIDVLASGIALVEPAYDGVAGNKRLSAAKFMAATGTQTLTKWDIGKTIFLPNTAAHTLNLPAVADVQAGAGLQFVKTTSDAAAVTLDGNSSENIDGSTTLATIDAQYDTAHLVSTGAAWIVTARDIT